MEKFLKIRDPLSPQRVRIISLDVVDNTKYFLVLSLATEDTDKVESEQTEVRALKTN